jgi:hypothetical protein
VSSSVGIDAIPAVQQLDLGSLLKRHDIDAMALVRPNVEALAQDAPDPPIRNRPIVLVAVALDEAGCDIRDGDHGSLRAGHQLGEDFKELRFDLEPTR